MYAFNLPPKPMTCYSALFSKPNFTFIFMDKGKQWKKYVAKLSICPFLFCFADLCFT